MTTILEGTASRFLKCRWSKTRHLIHEMQIGETLRFPPSQYFNAKQSVLRFNDAYYGVAKWSIHYTMNAKGNKSTVTRLAIDRVEPTFQL